MPRVRSFTNQSGFSLVEALLAATVFGMVVIGVVGALVYGRQSTHDSSMRAQATLLAEEGLEATRSVRDGGYANLANGTYGVAQSGNVWNLSGSSDTNGLFTRTIAIGSGGLNHKTVTSTVTWARGNATSSVSLSTQLTNWLASIVRSWTAPKQVGALDATGTMNGVKVATNGNYAYIVRTDGTPDFVIVNISDLTTPVVVGSLSLSGTPTNVTISGNYAYVTTSDNAAELRIINVSNPAAPVIVGTYDATGTADGKDVAVSGSYAYLCRSANGGSDEVVMINVSNPAAPTRTTGYSTNNTVYEIYVSGTEIYVVTSSNTAEFMQLSYTALLNIITLTTSINLTSNDDATTIDGFGTTLVVGQGTAIRTISDGLLTTLQGSLTLSGVINDITLNSTNNYALVGTSDDARELQVVSIATLTSPSLAGSLAASSGTMLSGVAYNAAYDAVVGVGDSDTQEAAIFVPN